MSGNPSTPTYDTLMQGGLTVTSTGTPALSGTYGCTGLYLTAMQAEVNAMLLAGATPAFADGSQSLNWPDNRNVGHAFNPAQFHELAVAISNFIVQCTQYGIGLIPNAPATSVTIA
jgi:hypothetical protein